MVMLMIYFLIFNFEIYQNSVEDSKKSCLAIEAELFADIVRYDLSSSLWNLLYLTLIKI
jgi:hypothetical protein